MWAQIQGTTLFLIEPIEPDLANYEYKTPSQSTASSTATSEDTQTQLAITALVTPAPDTSVPATIDDLTADGWKTFNMQYTVY